MTKRTYISLGHELQSVGYLSLNKAVQYLKENYPNKAISYPTALRLLDNGHLRAVRVGKMHRIEKQELDRFVEHGNRDIPRKEDIDPIKLINLHKEPNHD